MEQTPDVINPNVTERANGLVAKRRLKLVFCKGHQDQSLHNKLAKDKMRDDRLAEIGKLAAVFAHEVANPLGGLSASLQFALKDLATMDSPRKGPNVRIIRQTIQGALREVDRLVELLDDFHSNVPPQSLNLNSTIWRKVRIIRKRSKMTFLIGDKVVYPSQGPCLIGAVIKRTIAGERTRFYRLSFLDNSGDAVLIPTDKLRALPIRHLLAKAEIPKLLAHLEHSPPASENWKQRSMDNAKLLASGSAFDLAEIVESLTELSETKALLPRDRQLLEKAKKLLICEISEVMGESRDAAEGEIDRALKSKRTAHKHHTSLTIVPSRGRNIKHKRAGITLPVR